MQRRLLSLLIGLLLLLPSLAACAPKSDPGAAEAIRLYQVLPAARAKSALVQGEGEGEAIALINAGTRKQTINGWTIEAGGGRVKLPRLSLEPGQVLYLANDATYFAKYWNRTPDYEYGVDADRAVPDLKSGQSAPVMKDTGDLVKLLDEKGKLIDILAFGAVADPPAPWSGPPVELVNSFPLTPGNQVITRLREGDRLLLEPRADSWSGGTRTDPERVFYAGQSNFPVRTVSGPMTLTALSAPDNAGTVLFQLVDRAQKSIRLTGYQFNHKELAERLVAAVKRGVRVQVALERNPAGSEPYDGDKEAHQILHEGGVEILYYHKWDGDLSSRFNPVHAKYVIIDDEIVMVATGNYVGSVYNTTNPTCGNREWLAVIQGGPGVVELFREVWDFDFGSNHVEVRPYNPERDRPLQPDTYDPGPCLKYTAVKPEPLTVTGQVTLTRILSPDNTLDREQGFLGLLRNAKRELWVSAAYINKWWGSPTEPANFTNYPQPYLQEIVAAARRGVEVKVLLDRRNVRADSLRDNHQVVDYLNDLAKQEGLKLEARLVNMDQTGIGRSYHNKSLIVDGAVVISSINGSENSFRYAREMAIKLEAPPAFVNYYRDLFLFDWNRSDRPNEPWSVQAIPLHDGTRIDWAANVELDVVGYEVYYKRAPGDPWQLLTTREQPGFTDSHTEGIWGVVAVTESGVRSDCAEVTR
ncbi:MAG: phospholipase D-like domain-containing protein [Bacillota bacterium]